MKAEDLSFVADALLALCDQDQGAPFYTESTIENKSKYQPRNEPFFAHLSRHGDDPLLRVECEDIFDTAQLTERQAAVLTRRLDGWTFEEISMEAGGTKQASQRVFVQALKKLAKAFMQYPYKGLSEIYRREVRRNCRAFAAYRRA